MLSKTTSIPYSFSLCLQVWRGREDLGKKERASGRNRGK